MIVTCPEKKVWIPGIFHPMPGRSEAENDR
jgi:hypothetical protein